jgi:2-phospho-L-lactate guanylyltransferase
MSVTLILPIKEARRAKTRLGLPDDERRAIMAAFVEHVVRVASSSVIVGEVVVVGSLELVPPGHDVSHLEEPAAHGLNAAVQAGRTWAARRRPTSPIAVLPVDLPGLTARELDDALVRSAPVARAFVADHHGVGTTLVTACAPNQLRTAYGAHSAARHRVLGLVPLEAGVGLRHDVDTRLDLRAVAAGRPPVASGTTGQSAR